MALLDFQTAVGRLVRASRGEDPLRGLDLAGAERALLSRLVESDGFRFTVDVQRSWCVGRAARAARLTLSILPAEYRRELVQNWVSAGGGTAPFFAVEADSFLDFIARHLPDPSHALTVCRLEQATLRASEGAHDFATPDRRQMDVPGCVLHAGRSASLVHLRTDPHLLLDALLGERPVPALSPTSIPVLFAPGLDGLFRAATSDEVMLWDRLAVPVALSVLLREGYQRDVIEAFVLIRAAEYG